MRFAGFVVKLLFVNLYPGVLAETLIPLPTQQGQVFGNGQAGISKPLLHRPHMDFFAMIELKRSRQLLPLGEGDI